MDQPLPEDIAPFHYDIEFKPLIYSNTTRSTLIVEGNIKMHIHCNKSTKIILFHTRNIYFSLDDVILNILNIDTNDTNDVPLFIGYTHYVQEHLFKLVLSKPLKRGKNYILNINYFESAISRHGFLNFDYSDFIYNTTVER